MGKKRTLLLPGTAFIRRFLRHALPKGLKRIRHYGLLDPAHRAGTPRHCTRGTQCARPATLRYAFGLTTHTAPLQSP